MTIPQMRVEDIYSNLKKDLQLCVKYQRKNRPEMVKEYFWTDKWDEIEKQIQVICQCFSTVQKIQLERVITELHNFYITNDEQWTTSERKSKPKSKNVNGGQKWKQSS